MPSLTITSGSQSEMHFELARRPLSIGREPSRDIQITDPKVSRKHAIIRFRDDRHLIAPVKALNGILINGNPVADETLLNDGDEIVLGDTTLRFADSVSADQTNAVFHRKNADPAMRGANTMM